MNNKTARLTAGAKTPRAGRHSRTARSCELFYRRARPPQRPLQPPPKIIHNTIHQTVVHLHPASHCHTQSRITVQTARHGRAALLVGRAPAAPAAGHGLDLSRPSRIARRLLRILSMESARRIMRPFYQDMFRRFWAREREARPGKPARFLPPDFPDRRRTLCILYSLFRRTSRTLEETVLQSLLFRRYARTSQRAGERILLYRYAIRELPVAEDLRRLPPAGRVSPPPEPQVRGPAARAPERRESAPPKPEGVFRLNGAEFQILVSRVADTLGRQRRLESLRQGGM